ncbi:DUF416 family protein [Ralstonia solanacearum]|uniref:DUF416 family protein n=1 Tax=Ralstonia solanacearum TaxID=305 RepID=UPI0012FD8D1F|nr:DUF416 family protein [Ralstonia solanacearum]
MTVKMMIFSEDELRNRLAVLPMGKMLAFSAGCAEMLMPAYERYAAKASVSPQVPRMYRVALDAMWNLALGTHMGAEDLTRMEQDCLFAIPSEDEAWQHGEPYAEDAGAAVTFTLRVALSRDPQNAVWAARRLYDALDHFVGAQVESGAGWETAILEHPLIQGEFARQQDGLVRLEQAGAATPRQTIIEIWDAAKARAVWAFDASDH